MWIKCIKTTVLVKKMINWPVHPVAVKPQRETKGGWKQHPSTEGEIIHIKSSQTVMRRWYLLSEAMAAAVSPSDYQRNQRNRVCDGRSRGSSIPAAPHPPPDLHRAAATQRWTATPSGTVGNNHTQCGSYASRLYIWSFNLSNYDFFSV